MKTRLIFALLPAFCIFIKAQTAPGEESWPKSYQVGDSEVVLYEPEVESWQGSNIDARFAVGIRAGDEARPLYGSFAAHATAIASRESRTVSLFNFSVDEVRFPDAPERVAEFARIIESITPEKPVQVSLDELLARVPKDDVVTKTTITTPSLNKVPEVIVRFENSVLVAFDGRPMFRSIAGTGLQAAVNTPATLLREERTEILHLLTNDGFWLTAPKLSGPWTAADEAPRGLDRIPPDHPVAQAIKNVWPPAGAIVSVPRVVTSDEPAELIQIDGKPRFSQIAGLPLVRVSNTDSALFFHTDANAFFVLISGRWFTSDDLTGPWIYVPQNRLPAAFAEIPADDPSAEVRVSIAGTREAEEAVKEAQIPSYRRVNVREAPEFVVDYEGEPIFEPIAGIDLDYSINTVFSVFRHRDRYYCCHEGVWYMSDSAFGRPWRYATRVPVEVYSLPPSCPIYYNRFCEVDYFDDDCITYRHTPGYWGTYIDPDTLVPVYGSGWRYPAYASQNSYYGYGWTYGLGCRYVPHHGFVRRDKHVAHTNWLHHSDRDKKYVPASVDRWGGKLESGRWRASSARTESFADYKGRGKIQLEELASTYKARKPKNSSDSKLKVIPLAPSRESRIAKFEPDMRSNRKGEVYHPKKEETSSRGRGISAVADPRKSSGDKKDGVTEKHLPPTREKRSGQDQPPSHIVDRKKSDSPPDRDRKSEHVGRGQGDRPVIEIEKPKPKPRQEDTPPSRGGERHEPKKEIPARELKIERREEPRRIDPPKDTSSRKRDDTPSDRDRRSDRGSTRQIEQPRVHIEKPVARPRQETPPSRENRVERREEPRRIDPPRDSGSAGRDSRSNRDTTKKDDKKDDKRGR